VLLGNAKIVKTLIDDFGVDPSYDNNKAVQSAAHIGYSDVVEVLLDDDRVNPYVNENYVIRISVIARHEDVIEILLDHPKINLFDNRILSIKGLDNYVRKYISDSLKAVSYMHYKYNYSNNNTNIYRSDKESKNNIIGLYYRFLRHLIRKKSYDIIDPIIKLTYLIGSADYDTRLIINYAAKSILNPKINIPNNWSTNIKNYYNAFRGFLMLVYVPNYTAKNILYMVSKKVIGKEVIYLTAKLIGAYIGMKQLLEEGYVYSYELKHKTESILGINLMELAD
jgi:hypothetical protein